MAVTAVTITSGPTVVGRSVTLSGTLSRDGGGTNNNLNFLCYNVGYVAVYTITKLSDSSTFYNAAGTAGSGIAWTWTGTLPEGDYLAVTVNLNEAPYTTLATSASNVGLVQLRKPLPGIWTPNRDSRGLFVPKADGVDSPISSTAGGISTRKFHYNYAVAGSNGIYTTVLNKILRRSDQTYGPVNLLSVNTPYGVGIDAQTGWQFGSYPTQPGGYNVTRQTWISLFYIYDAAKAITNYPRFFGAVGNNPSNRSNTISWNNPDGEQALVVTSNTGFSGGEVAVNGVGNGLHCMVVTSVASTSAGSIRIFLDGQFVATTTGPNGWLGGEFPNTDFFANSVSQSGLNIGNILFNAILYNYVAPDSEALKLSSNPYSYFFRDAPKTTAKRRLFSGVLSLPDPPTEFTSTKAGRVPPRVLTQQPQGSVQIDWSNPLTRGITFAQIGNQTQDVVFNGMPTLIGSNNSRIDQYGRGFNLAGSNAFAYPNQSKYFPTTQVSVLSITRPATGQAANTSADIFGRATTANSQAWGLQFFVSGFTTNGFTWNVRNSGGFSYSCTAGLGDNYQYTRPFVVSGSAGINQSGKLYVDGILKGTQVTPLNDTLYAPGSAVGLAIGSANGSTASYNGSTFLNVVWNRTLTDSEHLQLGQNPWQLFKPAAGRLYFLPATTTTFKGGRFLPQRWKTQPQGQVQIDWSNSITQDLFFAYLPGNPRNLAADRYQGGRDIISFSDTNNFVYGPAGKVSLYQRLFSKNNTASTGAFTFGFPGQLNKNVSTGSDIYLFADQSYGLECLLGFSVSGANLYFTVAQSNFATVDAFNSGLSIDLFDKRTRFLSYQLVASQVLTAFLGSTQILTGSTTWDGTLANYITLQNVDVSGANAGTSLFATGGFAWKRQLSTNELGLLDENPWQIYKPNPGRIYFLPGATRRGKFLFLFS